MPLVAPTRAEPHLTQPITPAASDSQGPFVHISCCLVVMLLKTVPLFASIQRSKPLRVQMLAVGCAVGVSSTFGAPIGGVLFSIEVRNATDCHRLPPTATDCHRLSPTVTDCHRLSPTVTDCHRFHRQ